MGTVSGVIPTIPATEARALIDAALEQRAEGVRSKYAAWKDVNRRLSSGEAWELWPEWKRLRDEVANDLFGLEESIVLRDGFP